MISTQIISDQDREFIEEALKLAVKNVSNGGGPFGAVITRDGRIISTGENRVTANNDPTAHAEIQAIRAACDRLGTFDLSGCTLYSSCEPCPMCLGAIYWAHISNVFYAANQYEAAEAGFDDSIIYREFEADVRDRMIPIQRVYTDNRGKPFDAWRENQNKVKY